MTPWQKRLDVHLPQLGSRSHVSITPCGFRSGWNGIWVDFLRVSPVFPVTNFIQPLIHIQLVSFHFIRPCDDASDMVCRHPCYSQTFNKGTSLHLILWPGLMSGTSWGYTNSLIIRQCLLFSINYVSVIDLHVNTFDIEEWLSNWFKSINSLQMFYNYNILFFVLFFIFFHFKM